MRDRRIMIGALALLVLILAVRHPNADIRILTHDASDRSPHIVKAAVDLGLFAISIVVTWTSARLS